MAQVILANAQTIASSGETGPGTVTCTEAEGQALVDAGYAAWAPDGGP